MRFQTPPPPPNPFFFMEASLEQQHRCEALVQGRHPGASGRSWARFALALWDLGGFWGVWGLGFGAFRV